MVDFFCEVTQVHIKGQIVKTTIEADSVIHAKSLAEWHFGIGSVAGTPTKLGEDAVSASQTPEQARLSHYKLKLIELKMLLKPSGLDRR